MEGTIAVSESKGFPTLTDVGVVGSALLISAAYVAIYHFGEQLAGVVPSALLKAAPFLPPQTWALGIAVTAVALAALYIAYSVRSNQAGQSEAQERAVATPATDAAVLSAQPAKTVTHEEWKQILRDRLGSNEKYKVFFLDIYDRFISQLFVLHVDENPQIDNLSARFKEKQKAVCFEIGQSQLVREFFERREYFKNAEYFTIRDAMYPNGIDQPVEESYALAWGIRLYADLVTIIYSDDPANQEATDYFKALVGFEDLKELEEVKKVPNDITLLVPKVKDEWPDTKSEMKKLLGDDLLVELFSSIDQEVFITVSGAKKVCLGCAKEAVRKEFAREYSNNRELSECMVYLRQYYTGVEWPLDWSKLEVKDEALLLQKGLEVYKKIIDAMEAVRCPNVAAEFKEHFCYEELEKQLPKKKVAFVNT